jgi:hypothetical protein
MGDDTMTIITLIILSALLLAGGAFILKLQPSTGLAAGSSADEVKRNAARPVSRTRAAPAARSPYRATSIECSATACDAAKAINGKRFLDRDRVTPALPLERCDMSRCTCSYARHEDRRDYHEDRRHPGVGLVSVLYDRGERPDLRTRKRGRRKTDWA